MPASSASWACVNPASIRRRSRRSPISCRTALSVSSDVIIITRLYGRFLGYIAIYSSIGTNTIILLIIMLIAYYGDYHRVNNFIRPLGRIIKITYLLNVPAIEEKYGGTLDVRYLRRSPHRWAGPTWGRSRQPGEKITHRQTTSSRG